MTESTTKLFAVTGRPIIHSKSPGMFRSCFKKENIDAAYFRLAAVDAKQAVYMCKHMGLSGMNVTAPYKEDMLKLVNHVHEEAKIIGSINTIVVKNGKLHGYNTDHYGVTQSFIDAGISVDKRKCLILGAGGAGKAAAYGLHKAGACVTIVNRTSSKAQELAESLGCEYALIENLESLLAENEIIVSSLSQNIQPIKSKWLLPSHIVFDANYAGSDLIKAAKSKNCTIVSAENWLVNQAVMAYFHFLGTMPNKAYLEEGLADTKLEEKKHTIATIGLMGCGKTSHGKVLAKKLKYAFKDTDDAIVEKQEKSIIDIFAEHGEGFFRELEKQELAESFSSPKPHVLSCGGGIVTHEKNRDLLSKNSLVVWLFASPKAIIARADLSKRPLLQVPDPHAKLVELYNARKGMYGHTADIVFSTEKKMRFKNTNNIISELEHIGLCKQ